MTALHRSWLYVPGHRPDRFAKAAASGADAVVIDLEDAVPPEAKEVARRAAVAQVTDGAAVPLYVRINNPDTPWARADVTAVAGARPAGIRIPKVEDPEQVRTVARWLRDTGADIALYCLIESALGVERAFDIAGAHVAGLVLGEADLAADLGTTDDDGLQYARSRCVVAARAAGLPPPVQAVFTNVDDLDGLKASCERGRRLGFLGRSAIHPRQLPVINTAYTPTAEEVADARALLDSAESAEAAFVLDDGRFVDPAITERARRVVQLADALPPAPATDTTSDAHPNHEERH